MSAPRADRPAGREEPAGRMARGRATAAAAPRRRAGAMPASAGGRRTWPGRRGEDRRAPRGVA